MSTIRTLLLAASLVATLLSCQNERNDGETSGTAVITLGGACIRTRVTGVVPANESHIKHWAYWMFNRSGRAVKCGVGNGTKTDISLPAGYYTVVVLANYPTSGIRAVPVRAGITIDALLERTTDLSDNAADCLVMKGDASVIVEEGSNSPIEVQLARLVSKVGVKKISVNYTKAALAEKTTILKSIYLTNLYRFSRYGSDYTDAELEVTRSKWYNSMGWHRWESEPADVSIDALAGDCGIDINLSAASPYTQAHYFYCYPNPSKKEYDTHEAASWSIRSTRLVIETQVEGKSYYYQIQIPPMRRNTPYVAEEVVIRDLGSLDPEGIVPGSLEITFAPAVQGWEGDYGIEEES